MSQASAGIEIACAGAAEKAARRICLSIRKRRESKSRVSYRTLLTGRIKPGAGNL
jgi:hypothetical protein